MAISDKYGNEIKKRLESHQAHGMWGDSKFIYGKNGVWLTIDILFNPLNYPGYPPLLLFL